MENENQNEIVESQNTEIAPEQRYYNGPVTLEEAESYITSGLVSTARNYVAIGYWLRRIRDGKLYEEEGHQNFEQYVHEKYGKDKGWASKCIKVNQQLSKDGDSPLLDSRYRDYSTYQLAELAYMTEEQREQATPEQTIKQLQEIRKSKEIPYYDIDGQQEMEKDYPEVIPVVMSQLFPEEEIPKQEEQEPPVVEQAEVSQYFETKQEPVPGEPRKCITGKSKYGFCACCGKDGIQCCAACIEDCNGRCGWLEESTEEALAANEPESAAEKQQNPETCCGNETGQEKESDHDSLEPTDLELLRAMLERKKRLLATNLGIPGIDESDEHIRMQKLEVSALASAVCDLENLIEPEETVDEKPEQPELPYLRNNDQRAAFIDAYESWPLWIETKETGERYYRYDLPDGTSFVVKTYHSMLYDYKAGVGMRYKEGYGANEQYILEPGKFFRDCQSNRSSMIEKLKELQKREKES